MMMLGYLLMALAIALGIVSFVCFIMVVVKMFQNDQQTLGIVTIILFLCTGIGGIIAFVVGWMNVTPWKIRNVMLAWTGSFVAAIVLYIIAFVLIGAAIIQENPDFQQGFDAAPQFDGQDF